LPHAAIALVAEFIGPGEALCFALTCTSTLEATQVISGGIMPPASKAYFMSSISLLSFAIESLNISGVAWLHHVSARGMLPQAQALRAREPPVDWDHKTCEIAAQHGQLDMLLWLRAQRPPCTCRFRACLAATTKATKAKFLGQGPLGRSQGQGQPGQGDTGTSASPTGYEDGDKSGRKEALARHVEVLAFLQKGIALVEAAETGGTAAVRLLVESGADVNAKVVNENTPLMAACEAGHAEVATFLCGVPGVDVNSKHFGRGTTALILACQQQGGNFAEVVALLVDAGALVNSESHDRRTPIAMAAKGGGMNVVRLLIASGADVNVRSARGETPLMWSLLVFNEGLVDLLLDSGADANMADHYGGTPLMKSAGQGLVDMTATFLAKGASVNTKDHRGNSALKYACEMCHVEVARLLIANGADFEDRCYTGWTPLMWACKVRNGDSGGRRVEAVQLLLAEGSDVNVVSMCEDGTCPLILACEMGMVEVAGVLVDHGASVNVYNSNGATPLTLACEQLTWQTITALVYKGADVNSPDKSGVSPLIYVCHCGRGKRPGPKGGSGGYDYVIQERMARLLLDKGADVNARDMFGYTPLLDASLGHEKLVTLLLSHGADVNGRNDYGETPLLCACGRGNTELARFFVDAGADVNVRSSFGYACLLLACERKCAELALLLIGRGADVDAQDNNGRTALHYACREGLSDVAMALMNKGADVNTKSKHGNSCLKSAKAMGSAALVAELERRGAVEE